MTDIHFLPHPTLLRDLLMENLTPEEFHRAQFPVGEGTPLDLKIKAILENSIEALEKRSRPL